MKTARPVSGFPFGAWTAGVRRGARIVGMVDGRQVKVCRVVESGPGLQLRMGGVPPFTAFSMSGVR